MSGMSNCPVGNLIDCYTLLWTERFSYCWLWHHLAWLTFQPVDWIPVWMDCLFLSLIDLSPYDYGVIYTPLIYFLKDWLWDQLASLTFKQMTSWQASRQAVCRQSRAWRPRYVVVRPLGSVWGRGSRHNKQVKVCSSEVKRAPSGRLVNYNNTTALIGQSSLGNVTNTGTLAYLIIRKWVRLPHPTTDLRSASVGVHI